jgi:NAD(P)-dependent dehydrogenase (short-subunit alcohol dehydrogenase family)
VSKQWTVENIPDQRGKVVVVTGANSGIGLEAARALAGKNAQVILAVRSLEKGEKAAAQIRRMHPQAQVQVMALDLADLQNISAFAQAFRSRYTCLDILINNAGVMALPDVRTKDGFEMQFGTNHLGHFALTGQLLALLKATPGARVVTVSSYMHKLGQIHFEDLMWKQRYDRWGAYGQSKLANLLFAYELQRRLQTAGVNGLSVACHPGYSATNLQSVAPRMDGSAVMGWLSSVGNALFAQSAEMGALPTLYAATAPEVNGGDYIGPIGWGGMHGYPGKVQSNAASHDEAVAGRLWTVSEELTGVVYPFGQ